MQTEDKVVKSFDMSIIKKVANVPIISVCYNTEDYPGKYVARLWNKDQPTDLVVVADSLDEIRKAKPPEMMIVDRFPNDKPEIIETWF